MNLLGPELVRDLVSLIAEADDAIKVLVFKSADPDYFIAHVDMTQITEYRAEAARLTGEASIGLMPQRKPPYHCRTDRGSRSGRRQRVRACVRHALCRTTIGDFQPARVGNGCEPRSGRHPAPDPPHGRGPC
jgi:hypothetical protein